LSEYEDYIHTDAYKGFERLTGITRWLCRSHLHRYFVDTPPKDVKSPEATVPGQAIAYINKLFEIDQKLVIHSLEGRKEQRLIHGMPVLEVGRGLYLLQ
jgi:transposase